MPREKILAQPAKSIGLNLFTSPQQTQCQLQHPLCAWQLWRRTLSALPLRQENDETGGEVQQHPRKRPHNNAQGGLSHRWMPGSHLGSQQRQAPPGKVSSAAPEDFRRSPGQVSNSGEASTSGRRAGEHRWLQHPQKPQGGGGASGPHRWHGRPGVLGEASERDLPHIRSAARPRGVKDRQVAGDRVACPKCGYLRFREAQATPCPICVRRGHLTAVSDEAQVRAQQHPRYQATIPPTPVPPPAVSLPPLPPQKPKKKPKPAAQPPPKPVVMEIRLPDEVTVGDLARLLEVTVEEVEQSMAEFGETPSSDKDVVSPSNAELVCMAFGKSVIFSQAVLERDSDAVERPPVVTIMGHVDHGKTTLLDALRKTSVAAGEAGGITQHIGAFQVRMPDSGGSITFLDTPGHAAFSAMRARGAAVTDVVVLVVAADDGVKPQTREALHHAQASGCPIVVALTKCDRPGADSAAARAQLEELGLELEADGGTVQVIETAAPEGRGLVQLEEALLFQAELMELRASRTRPVVGAVVEARMDKGQGAMATVLVKRGILKVGQHVVLGRQWGKVRAMRDAQGESLQEAFPGTPVEISGLRGMPNAGDDFLVQPSEDGARRLSEARQLRKQKVNLMTTAHDSATSSSSSEAEGDEEKSEEKQLVVLVKADTQGSAEAVCASLEALGSEIVTVKAVPVGLGPLSTADVEMAVSMGAHVIGFNVKASNAAVDAQAKQRGVPILRHNVIYHLLEEVTGWMAAMAPQVEEEVVVGEAAILQSFPTRERHGSEALAIAGCRVHTGSVVVGNQFRVLRSGDQVWQGGCRSIKRLKQEVNQVGKGTECGILLEGCTNFQPGDTLHCITTKFRPQTAEDVANLAHTSKS